MWELFTSTDEPERKEVNVSVGRRSRPYLTAAKRTLMLDSDRPLTILSIMFSVSVIWRKEKEEGMDINMYTHNYICKQKWTRGQVTFLRMSSSLEPSEA